MSRILAGFSSKGESFLLTFPFIEREGGLASLGPQTIWIFAPLVNALVRISSSAITAERRECKPCCEDGLLIAE